MEVHIQSDQDNNGGDGGSALVSLLVICGLIAGFIWLFKTYFPNGKEGTPPEAGTAVGADPNSTPDLGGDCWLGQPCTPAFSQCDPAWGKTRYGNGTMCQNGCAPAAMAMIITALKGQRVYPREIADFALSRNLYVNGQGSKHIIAPEVAKQWGLQSRKIPGDAVAVTDAIASGALVIMSGHGHLPFVPTSDGGHYIVIRAADPANKDSVRIGNSAFTQTNDKSWSLSGDIVPFIHQTSVYAISR